MATVITAGRPTPNPKYTTYRKKGQAIRSVSGKVINTNVYTGGYTLAPEKEVSKSTTLKTPLNYFPTGTGSIGAATSNVTAVYQGKKTDKSSSTLVYGSHVDTKAGTVTTKTYEVTKEAPAPASAPASRSLKNYEVPVSSGVYNKYISDVKGSNSPYRRASSGDTAILSSEYQRAKEAYASGTGSVPRRSFNEFKAGAAEILPAINAEAERKSQQEAYFRSQEETTPYKAVNVASDWLTRQAASDRERFNNQFPTFKTFSKNDEIITDFFFKGGIFNAANEIITYPRDVSRGFTIATPYGDRAAEAKLFTVGERVSGGVNFAIAGVSVGAGFITGSGITLGRPVLQKGIKTVGVVGSGLLVADLALTPKERVASKFYKDVAIGGWLYGLSTTGSVIGKEFNPINRLTPIDYAFNERFTGYKTVKGRMMSDLKVNDVVTNKNVFVDTNYYVSVPKNSVLIMQGSTSGGSYNYVRSNIAGAKGDAYYNAAYKGLFNNYYLRSDIKPSGFGTTKFFRGDKLLSSTTGRVDPRFLIGESISDLGVSYTERIPEFTRERNFDISVSNALPSKPAARFQPKGEVFTVTRSDWVSATTRLGKAHNTIFNNAEGFVLSYYQGGSDATLFSGYGAGSFSNPVITLYNPVPYIPANKNIEFISTNQYGLVFKSKGATSNVGQTLMANRYGYIKEIDTKYSLSQFEESYLKFNDVEKVEYIKNYWRNNPSGAKVDVLNGGSTVMQGVGVYKQRVILNVPKVVNTFKYGSEKVYMPQINKLSTVNKSVPILASNLRLNGATDVKNALQYKLGFEIIGRTNIKTAINTNLKPMTSVKPITLVNSSFSSKSETKVNTELQPSVIINPENNFNITPDVNPTITPPLFKFGARFSFGGGGSSKKLLGSSSFKPKYVSSVEANIFKVKGRKPNKYITGSGIKIRPLIKI